MNEGKVVHISPGLHQRLKKFCVRRNITMQEFVEEAISAGMSAMLEEEKKASLRKHFGAA
jgi:hypothetical protein